MAALEEKEATLKEKTESSTDWVECQAYAGFVRAIKHAFPKRAPAGGAGRHGRAQAGARVRVSRASGWARRGQGGRAVWVERAMSEVGR